MTKNKTDDTKENKKPLWKKAFLGFVFIDAIVGIIFLICYFKGCLPFNNKPNTLLSSTSAPIDYTQGLKLDNKFRELVETQMQYDGFDQHIEKVVAVSYEDNAPTSFSLTISAVSDSHLYNLNIKGVQYKEGTDTLVSYLLCNNEIEGETNLYREQIKGYEFVAKAGMYVTSTPISGTEEHKTGYELIDNNFHVSQILEYKNDSSGTLSAMRTVIIEEGQPLYNYYWYLLNRQNLRMR